MLMYDENGDLRDYEQQASIVTCSACKKKYKQIITEQVPGFRDTSEDECPYCGHINHTSMSVEYDNYEIKNP